MYIITGINSGLGKFLYQKIPGSLGINRNNKNLLKVKKLNNAIILHCAFNAKRNIDNYSSYVEDNFFLTKELLDLKGIKKLIYFSSIDVYGDNSPYCFMKKCAEDLIIKSKVSSSIIRISALLGTTMRKNSLIKLFLNEKISLSKDSIFNYILQEDILKSLDIFNNTNGIFNFHSSDNISLWEVAIKFNLKGNFGNFEYKTFLGNSNNIKNLYPFNKNSLENIKIFIENKQLFDTY